MCMLSYYRPGIMPRGDYLQNGADVNPDGHGFAIVTERRELIFHKDMNAGRLIDRFLETRAKHPNGPALFHSRIATSGLVDITGCHPFKVGSDNRTVVAHNGILFSPGKGSTKSDTRIFAETMLPRFGSLDSPRKFAKLERWVKPGNKMVILTVNPQRRKHAYLVNEQSGIWTSDNEWHSNSDFYGWAPTKWHKPAKPMPWDTEPWPCDICGAWNSVSAVTLICSACHSCNDCSMAETECQCHYGTLQDASVRNAWRREPNDIPSHGTGVWERSALTREWERKPLALTAGTGWPGMHNS